jgi:hypothetical protein
MKPEAYATPDFRFASRSADLTEGRRLTRFDQVGSGIVLSAVFVDCRLSPLETSSTFPAIPAGISGRRPGANIPRRG